MSESKSWSEESTTSGAHTTRAYAVAFIRELELGPEVRRYMESIEGTFAPFGGHWLVHGTQPEVLEGAWDATIVMIGFPSLDYARSWYSSPAYGEIRALRSEHSTSQVVLLAGVPEGYRAAETIAKLFPR